MGTVSTFQRTLLVACKTVGDEVELARRLNIPLPIVVDWLVGNRQIPPKVFLNAVDIVLDSTNKRNIETRGLLEEVRERNRVLANKLSPSLKSEKDKD